MFSLLTRLSIMSGFTMMQAWTDYLDAYVTGKAIQVSSF